MLIVGGIGEGEDLTVSTVCKGLNISVIPDHPSYNQIAARHNAKGKLFPRVCAAE